MAKIEQKSGVLGLDPDLNKKNNPLLPSADMYRLDSYYPSESLSISKRKGFQKINSIALEESSKAASFTGLFEYVKSDLTRRQLATTSTKVYTYNTPTANIWNEISLANAGGSRTGTTANLYDFVSLNDQMYLGNGKDNNIRFDGVNLWKMGIAAPSTTATNATNGAGVLTGAYSYKITFVNVLGHESNPSTATNTITAASNALRLTSVPVSTDAQVTKRNIYRTTTGGSVWLLIGVINDNTTTTFDDNLSDSNLTIAVEGFSNGVPPVFSMAELYKGVAFYGGDPNNKSRVWFSRQGFPNAVDSNDYRDLDINGGDVLTGLASFQSTVVAFKNNSIWNAVGEDRNTFGFEKRVSSIGSINHYSIVEVPGKNYLAFIGNDNRFYFYDGINITPTAVKIEPVLESLNQTHLSRAVGAVSPLLNQVRWIVPSSGFAECDLMIWYDYAQDKWGTVSISNVKGNFCATLKDSFNKPQFCIAGIYNDITKTGGGFVWYSDTGGSDDGVSITSDVIDRGHPKQTNDIETNKMFYSLIVWFKPITGAVLNVYCYLNTPENDPVFLGTIDCSASSGQASLGFNQTARRIYFQFKETSTIQGQVLRGWRVYYKDVGQYNA